MAFSSLIDRRTSNRRTVSISARLGELPVSAFLFYVALVAGFLIPLVRDLGGSYILATEWEISRYAFRTSAGAPATFLSYLQQICLLLLLVKAVFFNRNSHPLLSIFAITGFGVYGAVELLIRKTSMLDLLFGSVPITVFLIPLFILVAGEGDLSERLVRVSPGAALIAFMLGFGSIVRFHVLCGWDGTIGWSPARDYFALGISFLWITAAFAPEWRCGYLKKVLLCAISMLFAVLIATRSWMIQSVLVLLYIAVSSPSMSKKFRRVLYTVVLFMGAILVASIIFPDALSTFGDRLDEDTRSGQYEIFFSQVDPLSLVLGNGSSAGYTYGTQANYLFFDNQFIFLMFHYGICPALMLAYVLLKTIVSSNAVNGGSCRFVAVMYLAALLGLSNYYSYALNPGIACLFIGFGISVSKCGAQKLGQAVSK